jgi:hypothetical protein
MSVEFFKEDCRYSTNEMKFGLYDAENSSSVRIKLTDEDIWNATVLNSTGKNILVTAIDNCVDIFRQNGEMDNCCDCMLTYDTTILFIELKNKRNFWQSEGLAQIENVVKIMIAEIPDYYNNFKKRKAIVANRRHRFPAFQESNPEQRQLFWSKYKMRIQFETEIIVK